MYTTTDTMTTSPMAWPAVWKGLPITLKKQREVSQHVERGAHHVKAQELAVLHPHAARQGWSHGVHSRDELGEDQGHLAALVERLSGAQDASLGVGGDLAKKTQKAPSRAPAGEKQKRVAG